MDHFEVKKESEKYYGFYRAKVVNNKDPNKFGRVYIWIPDVMPDIPDNEGIWARPGNNPIGGRNMEEKKDQYYMGSSMIPKIGAWLWIFFEAGNINRPYYFSALDLENTPTLPENQQGLNYEHKWTLLRSHKGRAIVISDDPNDERVEITGKKRDLDKLPDPPTGDWKSVYKIDGNQTVILLDEVKNREKLLIRTYKGDYIHVDIDERKLQCYFQDDILIKTDGNLHLKVAKNIRIEAGQNIYETALGNTHRLTTNFFHTATSSTHTYSGQNDYQYAGTYISQKTGGSYTVDSAVELKEQGASVVPKQAQPANPDQPKGDRKT